MAKKKLSLIPETTKKVEVTPKDLLDKWGGIKHIATATHCLDKGSYPHQYLSVVRESILYLTKLHETLVEDALKHPQAHMITELKEIQNQNKKEAKKNGKAGKSTAPAGVTNSATSTGSRGDTHPPEAAGPENTAHT